MLLLEEGLGGRRIINREDDDGDCGGVVDCEPLQLLLLLWLWLSWLLWYRRWCGCFNTPPMVIFLVINMDSGDEGGEGLVRLLKDL